jgi:chromosome transmission fidelity protein 1
MSYMLLDGVYYFTPLVEQCRSIILTGGTLEPVSDLLFNLFPTLKEDRIVQYSAAHVIAPDQLLVLMQPSGLSGRHFHFTFDTRHDLSMVTYLRLYVPLRNLPFHV